MSNTLLARFAENAFWMARYMSRAENLSRILDVNENIARNRHDAEQWLPIVQLHADNEEFFKRYREARAESVLRFYVIDRENPNSVAWAVWAARENARSIRHLISIDIWAQLNVFFNWTGSIRVRDLALSRVSALCAEIKERCQTHHGIVVASMYRDQTWLFYELGRYIELADQTTRLVDVNYNRIAPTEAHAAPIEASQWNALLRSAAAYHGYLRRYPSGIRPADVAGFILFDRLFPRSLTGAVATIRSLFEDLTAQPELAHVPPPWAELAALEDLLATPVADAIDQGMQDYLDRVQVCLIALSSTLAETYFGGDGRD